MKAVVLTGQVLPGADAEQVWSIIAGLFKMDAAQFRTRVLARCPLTIKHAETEQAESMRQTLMQHGAHVQVFDADDDSWQLAMGDRPRGPVPRAYLRDAYRAGTLHPDTPLRTGSSAPWVALRDVIGSLHADNPISMHAPAIDTATAASAAHASPVVTNPAIARSVPEHGAQPVGVSTLEQQPFQATAAAQTPRYAGFWKRVLAYCIDAMIVGIPAALLAWLITWLAVDDADGTELAAFIAGFEWWLAFIVLGALYWPLMEASRQQATVGKRVLGLRVADVNGARLGVGRAYARHCTSALNQITSGIGYALAAWTARKQALHDLIAGTVVVNQAADQVGAGLAAGPAAHPVAAARAQAPASMSHRPAQSPVVRAVWIAAGAIGIVLAIVIAGYRMGQSDNGPPSHAASAARQRPAAPPPSSMQAPPAPAGSGTAAGARDAQSDMTNQTPTAADTASPFSPLLEPAGRIGPGRCHMGVCSWVKWLSVRRLSAGPDMDLRASVLGGSSEHAGADDYPSSAQGVPIQWDTQPHDILVTCSYTRPSVSTGTQTTALVLNPDGGVPGALESTAEIYFQACHSDFDGYPVAIRRHGYDLHEPGNENPTVPSDEEPDRQGRGLGTAGEALRICEGRPSYEFSDPDAASDWGTRISCTASGGLRLSLLTNNDTRTPRDTDTVHYYALTALANTVRAVPMFDGAILFNRSTPEEIRRYFDGKVVPSHGSLGGNRGFDSAWKVRTSDGYVYFRFKQGRLVNFALADFDIDSAN